jgi:hypothetical protein
MVTDRRMQVRINAEFPSIKKSFFKLINMKNLIATALFLGSLFYQQINAQTLTRRPLGTRANPALQISVKEYGVKKIPSLWGEKPNGFRVEIRIANAVFVQQEVASREAQQVFGKIVLVNNYHQPQAGQLYGYYDVTQLGEEAALSFSRGGSYQSVRTEGDYTVSRLTLYGDVQQNQALGYRLNTTEYTSRSILQSAIKVSGNTELDGTAVNTSLLGGAPIVLTVNPSALK